MKINGKEVKVKTKTIPELSKQYSISRIGSFKVSNNIEAKQLKHYRQQEIANNLIDTIEEQKKVSEIKEDKRKNLKTIWKSQTLVQSLYNDGDVPKISDIDQGGDNLTYQFKSYSINDCYLLTNLMGLAKKNPNFIKEIIKIKNENEIEVTFHEIKITDKKKDNKVVVTCEPTGVKKSYSVKKDEAIKWKTCHRALWPVVIEIAYAKFLKNNVGYFRDVYKHGGHSAVAMSHLTGKKSKYEEYTQVDQPRLKDYSNVKYDSATEKIYNKIKKSLDEKKVVTVAFRLKSVNQLREESESLFFGEKLFNPSPLKTNSNDLAYIILGRVKDIRACKSAEDVKRELDNRIFNQNYKKWLIKNNLKLEDLITLDEKKLYEFLAYHIANPSRFTTYTTGMQLQEKQEGITANHSFLVLDVLEHEGLKYVVFKNAADRKTKINYKKSTRMPKTIKFPDDALSEKNECMMELSHFHKKLLVIHYGNY